MFRGEVEEERAGGDAIAVGRVERGAVHPEAGERELVVVRRAREPGAVDDVRSGVDGAMTDPHPVRRRPGTAVRRLVLLRDGKLDRIRRGERLDLPNEVSDLREEIALLLREDTRGVALRVELLLE